MNSESKTIQLEYKIQMATSGNGKFPAIIMLHGYGSNAADLFSFASYLPSNHTVISLEAPIALPMGGNAWYEINFDENQDKWSDDAQALNAIDVVIDSLKKLSIQYDLDSDDLTLLGFSQGAILSWALALNNKGIVRRIIALSGYINKDIIKDANASPDFMAYAAHGSIDPVIPIAWAKTSIEPISKKHPEIHFHEYPDGHTVSQENFTKMLAWLEKTNR